MLLDQKRSLASSGSLSKIASAIRPLYCPSCWWPPCGKTNPASMRMSLIAKVTCDAPEFWVTISTAKVVLHRNMRHLMGHDAHGFFDPFRQQNDHKIDLPSVHMVGMVVSGATRRDSASDPKNGCFTTRRVTARDTFICASITTLHFLFWVANVPK